MKYIIKQLVFKIRFWRLKIDAAEIPFIGRYTLLSSKYSGMMHFGRGINVQNFVHLVAEDNGKLSIGDNVYIGDYSTIRASRAIINIGSDTMIGQQVKLISTNHQFRAKEILIRFQDIDTEKKGINIGKDCWLGAGCVILPGVNIGNGVVIGANAVVTKDISDFCIAVGNPAKIISTRL